jgi:hypothetical protein
MGLRIGSTRPIPINAMADAKATAQTALGWRHTERLLLSVDVVAWKQRRRDASSSGPRLTGSTSRTV